MSSLLNPTTNGLPPTMEISNLFGKCTTKDSYNNCIINLSETELNQKQFKETVKKAFEEFIQNKEGFQHLIVRISQNQHRVYKVLVTNGFKVHHNEQDALLFKRCLGHQPNECNYPPYKTMSIGVTVVIFNANLTEFLAVQEKTGPYKGWKAPTGSVDYENEDERQAAVREVYEETNLEIQLEQLQLVAMAPTNSFRGRSPDRNFVFTCKIESANEIKPQEKEIKSVAWLSVKDFLEGELPVSHNSRPLVLQEVVRIAKANLISNQGWVPNSAYWGSGKPAVLYQYPQEKK